jgi:hypothetical protein
VYRTTRSWYGRGEHRERFGEQPERVENVREGLGEHSERVAVVRYHFDIVR